MKTTESPLPRPEDDPMIAFASSLTDPSSVDQGNASALMEKAGDIAEEARQRLAEADEILKTVINDRPALAIGVAVAVGVILGWLIKRR
jgi:ElaB/YqjD/DUF883 family membrane-anchored ribosome-binding protein